MGSVTISAACCLGLRSSAIPREERYGRKATSQPGSSVLLFKMNTLCLILTWHIPVLSFVSGNFDSGLIKCLHPNYKDIPQNVLFTGRLTNREAIITVAIRTPLQMHAWSSGSCVLTLFHIWVWYNINALKKRLISVLHENNHHLTFDPWGSLRSQGDLELSICRNTIKGRPEGVLRLNNASLKLKYD